MYYHYGKWDPVFRGCRRPLLGGNECTITMGSGILCSEVGLFLEVTTVLSLSEVERGCPLFGGSTVLG